MSTETTKSGLMTSGGIYSAIIRFAVPLLILVSLVEGLI